MAEIITKEIAKKLMEDEGEIRGAVLKTDVNFILREKGKKGLREVEKEVENLGYPFHYDNIQTMKFYPMGLRGVTLLAIKKVFNFSDEKIREMGLEAPKSSFLTHLFMKYFLIDLKHFWRSTPKIWRTFITTSDFVPLTFDEENKMVICQVKGVIIHPIFCIYMLGITETFLKLLTGSKKISCKETKCPFRGDEYHEFHLTW